MDPPLSKSICHISRWEFSDWNCQICDQWATFVRNIGTEILNFAQFHIFFYHIYLARVSRLMPKSFGFLCISPASTNRNINKFTKCEHLLLATNAGQWVSVLGHHWCFVWFGLALLDQRLLAACTAGHTKGAFFPASQYILRQVTSVDLKSGL